MTSRNTVATMLLYAAITLLCACSKADQPMPLTKENIMSYRSKLVAARDKMTAKDRETAQKSLDGSKKLFAQTFVEPMQELGFSYDQTVKSCAEGLEQGKLKDADQETRTEVEGFLVMAKSVDEFAAKNGFISADTKKSLDRIQLK